MHTKAISLGLRRIASALSEQSRRERDYKHLRGMPDALLEDLGLTRADVEAVKPRFIF